MRQALLFMTLLISLMFVSNLMAQDKKKVELYGDFRFRIEMDRNSMRTNGTLRDDRDRMRYRLRLGFKYMLDDHFEFGGRIRSGNPLNQQSPHVTLGKEFQPDAFWIDKAYLKAKTNGELWAWVGKNSMPFWEQDEMLWDNDVEPEGIAIGSQFQMGENSKLTPVLGYFIAGHTGKKFGNDHQLTIAQLKFAEGMGNNALTLSSGYIAGKDIPNKPDGTGTYLLDYGIWASSLQFKLKKAGITIGADFFKNFQNYKGNAKMNDVYEDQTTGYVASISYDIKKFQIAYYHAHIEKFAVIDFLAQDDWVRWGNNNYTRSSNLEGHEFRIKYKINDKFNTVLRVYLAHGIVTTNNTLETGTRIRLDSDIKF